MNKYLSHSGALRFPNIGGKFKKHVFLEQNQLTQSYPELDLPTTVNKPIPNIQILPFDHSTDYKELHWRHVPEGSLKKL